MLLNNLLKFLRSPLSSSTDLIDNPTLLSPSMSEIANTKPATKDLFQKTAQIQKNFLTSPAISLPLKPELTPYEPHRFEHQFTTSQTSLLLQKCKSMGITITHAITASIALSILKVAGIEAGEYTTSLPTSVRDTFPAPYNSPSHAALLAITSPLPVIPITTSTPFLSLANTVKETYLSWKNDKDTITSHAVQAELFDGLVKAGVINSSNFAGKATVVMSSLGVVEKYLTIAAEQKDEEETKGEKVGVEDFWVGQIQGNTKVILFLYTFAGKMRVAACYNRRFHEDDAVRGFVGTVVQRVYEELGVDSSSL
ncbi:hypothetical protein TWF281_006515 [Arthrobotrys megalospora]